MSIAYIGIGSNLGDRQKNIETALEKLKSRKGIELKGTSSLIETDPVGDEGAPKFLNACCMINTTLYPDELLGALKSIERELGRDRDCAKSRLSPEEQLRMLKEGRIDLSSVNERQRQEEAPKRWGPRAIDLDILFYDDVIVKGANLVIPHPLLHKRMFVLRPLTEIAADFIHPVFKKSINELLFEYRVEYESS